MNVELKIGSVYYGVIKRALEAMQVKAALDGKPDIVVATEEVMDALKAARIRELPSEPSRVVGAVKCELTLEELRDLKTAAGHYIGVFSAGAVERRETVARMRKLVERIDTTIKLNPVTKS